MVAVRNIDDRTTSEYMNECTKKVLTYRLKTIDEINSRTDIYQYNLLANIYQNNSNSMFHFNIRAHAHAMEEIS